MITNGIRVSPTVATARSPKLAVHGVTKSFAGIPALNDIDLEVLDGELLTILGPSGSGKTTLLQIICGLLEPDSGKLLIDQQDHTSTPVHLRDTGLVFQHYALFPHMTVAENIGFPLHMRGLSRSEIDSRVKAALDMIQLGHTAGRLPRELSGGQQQRVALARCFVYRPAIILMDEPLGALDKKMRGHMQIEIKRLHRETGATIIYVTHDQEEALALSDRICLMNQARIEQVDTPRQIYERPTNIFVADFIGVSNIFRGRVMRQGDRAVLRTAGLGDLPLPPASTDAPTDRDMALIVRPELFRIVPEGGVLSGQVLETVYAGSDTRVLLQAADGSTTHLRVSGGASPSIGETIRVEWNIEGTILVPAS